MATPFSPIVYHAIPDISDAFNSAPNSNVFVEENCESDSVNTLIESRLSISKDSNVKTGNQSNVDNLSVQSNNNTEESDSKECLHETILPYSNLNIPIIGYEIMEERSRFTVFKCHVQIPEHVGWFVFRRYTDFTRLQKKLKSLLPGINLDLPPKRWFGDNFDPNFLDERLSKLQTFVNTIIENTKLCQSKAFIEFFCMNDSTETYNNIEDDAISCSDRYASQILCDVLEKKNQRLEEKLEEKDQEIELLKKERNMLQYEIELLQNRLKEMYFLHG